MLCPLIVNFIMTGFSPRYFSAPCVPAQLREPKNLKIESPWIAVVYNQIAGASLKKSIGNVQDTKILRFLGS